jgi:hypothetical protein
MLSSVYQLSTDNDPVAFAKDSGNRLYWRADRKRLDAEQLRDSVLLVSGNLDNALGGPSQDLTPGLKRRTVYGKVSRYKPDEYLMLFDFPSPHMSAEKRFVTTVPAQRLFLMNSDFMQLQAEELAKRVAGEANNRERIRKAYKLVYGRDATEQEIALGVQYLKEEPLREYEERKKKEAEEKDKAGPGMRRRPGGPGVPPNGPPSGAPPTELSAVPKGGPGGVPAGAPGAAAKPEADSAMPPMPDEAVGANAAAMGDAGAMGMGMMAGLPGFGGPGGRRPGGPAVPEVKYEATAWGRYAKILLSSSEFLFVN